MKRPHWLGIWLARHEPLRTILRWLLVGTLFLCLTSAVVGVGYVLALEFGLVR